MSTVNYHRGIGFTVVELGECLWQWAILPPGGVKGLETKSGQIIGLRTDAIEIAKREIEKQDAGRI